MSWWDFCVLITSGFSEWMLLTPKWDTVQHQFYPFLFVFFDVFFPNENAIVHIDKSMEIWGIVLVSLVFLNSWVLTPNHINIFQQVLLIDLLGEHSWSLFLILLKTKNWKPFLLKKAVLPSCWTYFLSQGTKCWTAFGTLEVSTPGTVCFNVVPYVKLVKCHCESRSPDQRCSSRKKLLISKLAFETIKACLFLRKWLCVPRAWVS